MEWAQTSENVVTVRMEYETGWKQDFLKVADPHFDSPYCDRKLFEALLVEAQEREAPVSILGDLFDAMQGKSDKRGTKSELRPEYAGSSTPYFDLIVEDAVEFLRPYTATILAISMGNHETAPAKYNETNLIRRVCKALDVPYLGYAGFTLYQMRRPTGGHKVRKTEFFIHGSGGGGIGQGIIKMQRRQVWVLADIYLSGHIHEEVRSTRGRCYLSASGREVVDEALHVSIPSLKGEWNLSGGFAIERELPPQPLGACWLRFEQHPRVRGGIFVDALRAR